MNDLRRIGVVLNLEKIGFTRNETEKKESLMHNWATKLGNFELYDLCETALSTEFVKGIEKELEERFAQKIASDPLPQMAPRHQH